jgi:leucyl/phenylalanyl-tRNA--protein transferase
MSSNQRIQLKFTPEGIELAYRHGVFPMSDSHNGEIFWCLPEPRAIIPLDGFHVSRSLTRVIRRNVFEITINRDFEEVMRCCADRPEGTWISEDFINVYGELHRLKKAHSVEVLQSGRLVGGVYGVSLGSAFMAESMFHYETNASKVALAALVWRLNERGFTLLDVQYMTNHLRSLGAVEIPHLEYYKRLKRALMKDCVFI